MRLPFAHTRKKQAASFSSLLVYRKIYRHKQSVLPPETI